MKDATRLPNTSPYPALMAALKLFEGEHNTMGKSCPALSHRLHTFGDCVYELASLPEGKTNESPDEAPSKPPLSHTTAVPLTEAEALRNNSGNEVKSAGTCVPSGEAGIVSSAAKNARHIPASTSYPPISIRFVHPIPYAQLDQYHNLVHALSTALHQVAPHCTYGLPSPGHTEATPAAVASLSSVGLCIPTDVTPQERCAAAVFASELSLRALQPVVEGLLQRSCATTQQETLLLLPRTAKTMKAAAPQSVIDSDLMFSSAALFITATPTPVQPASPDTNLSVQTAPPLFYAGTVSLTVCISTDNKGDAALIRRYLKAFAEVEKAPVLLIVRESAEPPPGIGVAAGSALKADHSYVWWCTFVLAPHEMTSAAPLVRALRLARELRPTVLFHVNQERMAMHELLRQKLSAYAAHFFFLTESR
ncbi:ARP2/3 complex subunit, putative [Leishmania guyanensis]|uniref:ARP2/3 complex subunit, putative n=1 Tax=Leishmania guyanensis TaxID=5670 RepID=A0A1E1IR15_LEIGU|nr:ARP2/3 complex subunit, putative [Leishmania guyanensis]